MHGHLDGSALPKRIFAEQESDALRLTEAARRHGLQVLSPAADRSE